MLSKEEFILDSLDIVKNNALKIFNSTNFNMYLERCNALEKMDIPELEKERQANTYYALYLIKMGLLLSESHKFEIFVENKELVIGDIRITTYDIDFLEGLCIAESISFISKENGNVTEIKISLEKNLEQHATKKLK